MIAIEIRKRRGVSLLEVTTVVLVMGIVAAVAVPRFNRVVVLVRSLAAAERLSADLNYLRQQAITRSQPVTVTFNSSALAYGSTDVSMPERPGETFAVSLAEQLPGGELRLQPTLLDGVTYDIWGSPSAGGRLSVKQGPFRWDIEIDAETGMAEVLK